jgi:hypothetical protein
MAWGLSLFLWLGILAKIGLDRTSRLWVLAAIGSSPLFFVTLRSDGIRFFAQAIAFPLVTLAIYEAIEDRLLTSGMAIAGALLCRQMSIFYAPLLFLMAVGPNERLIAIDRERIGRAIKLGLPILAGLLAYLAYNAWRFGSPFDAGYSLIDYRVPMIQERIAAHGVWNLAYVPFNVIYLFLQGFHAEFAAPELVKVIGMDAAGTSILAASPWLLFVFLAPARRDVFACAALIIGLSLALLFYHSNGYIQHNVQRYTLDWLPAALLIIGAALGQPEVNWGRFEVFRLLVLWGMVLNLATVAILAVI